MDECEGLDFAVRGVVRDGHIVLDAPLAAPDGTYVTITPYRNGDVPELAEYPPLTEEDVQWFREHTDRLRSRAAAATRRGAPDAA